MSKNRDSLIFIIAILLTACALLIWNAYSRYQEYRGSQQQLVFRLTAAVANEIGLQLREIRERVILFAEEESSLIEQLSKSPDDDGTYALLSEKVNTHFNDHLAFTVTSSQGEILAEDFGDLVGESCRQEIHAFMQQDQPYQVYIHPQPGAYHFDVMAPWYADGGQIGGVFFVSFQPDVVSRLIRNAQLDGHLLVALKDSPPDLIEVTARGARDKLERNFKLTPEEIGRIAYKQPISGTRWVLADVPDEDAYAATRDAIARQTGLFIFALTIITIILLRFLKRAEQRRFAAESTLRVAHHELELRVRDRTRKLSETNAELQTQFQERQDMERVLKQREATLRAILDSTLDAIVVIDQVGTVQTFNKAAESMFGYGAKEVVGHNVSLLMPTPDREQHDDYLSHYLETGEKRVIGTGRRVQGRRKDGTTFPVDLTVSEAIINGRKVFTGILRDPSLYTDRLARPPAE